METAAVFILGIITGFLGNITGGGGYLILLPALLHMGMPTTLAIGTIKFGALGITTSAVLTSKNRSFIRKDHLKPLLLLAIAASILGPQLTFLFSEYQIKIISSILIILTAIVSLFSLKAKQVKNPGRNKKILGYGAFFLISTIFAAFGSGLGMLVTYALIGFLAMTPIETIATRRILGLISLPLQFVVFASYGQVDFVLGTALLIGSLIGGYVGINFAINKGNEFVKRAMAVVAIALVVSLFV